MIKNLCELIVIGKFLSYDKCRIAMHVGFVRPIRLEARAKVLCQRLRPVEQETIARDNDDESWLQGYGSVLKL